MIDKWDDNVPEKQKALTGAGMCHIRELVRGDSQLFRQNLPVSLRLVQHINEVAVFKDIFNLTGSQQVLHILRQP